MLGWARYEDEDELREDVLALFDEASRLAWHHAERGVGIRRERRARLRSVANSDRVLRAEIQAELAKMKRAALRRLERERRRGGKPAKKGGERIKGPKAKVVKKTGVAKCAAPKRCRHCGAMSPTHRCPGSTPQAA